MKKSSSSRCITNLSESVLHQVNMYALGATAAGVGLLALAKPAEAKIVYTPTNQPISWITPIDLNHDGINDFACTTWAFYNSGSSHYLKIGLNSGSSFTNQVVGRGSIASALKTGVPIGPKAHFIITRSNGNPMGKFTRTPGSFGQFQGPWMNGGKGVKHRYLGLRFFVNGKAHYGWARITVTPGANFTATFTGYAYETVANKGLDAGQEKERSNAEAATLGHLARGASSVSAWRLTKTAAMTH
jgi:hypothetical protein